MPLVAPSDARGLKGFSYQQWEDADNDPAEMNTAADVRTWRTPHGLTPFLTRTARRPLYREAMSPDARPPIGDYYYRDRMVDPFDQTILPRQRNKFNIDAQSAQRDRIDGTRPAGAHGRGNGTNPAVPSDGTGWATGAFLEQRSGNKHDGRDRYLRAVRVTATTRIGLEPMGGKIGTAPRGEVGVITPPRHPHLTTREDRQPVASPANGNAPLRLRQHGPPGEAVRRWRTQPRIATFGGGSGGSGIHNSSSGPAIPAGLVVDAADEAESPAYFGPAALGSHHRLGQFSSSTKVRATRRAAASNDFIFGQGPSYIPRGGITPGVAGATMRAVDKGPTFEPRGPVQNRTPGARDNLGDYGPWIVKPRAMQRTPDMPERMTATRDDHMMPRAWAAAAARPGIITLPQMS